jgi:hypothetical protein
MRSVIALSLAAVRCAENSRLYSRTGSDVVSARDSNSHEDVCSALGLTDQGGPYSFEIANIRAGLRGVPVPAVALR